MQENLWNEDGMDLSQEYVCSVTPTEFEKYCLKIIAGYAEENQLKDFSITHNAKISVPDGTYQIDVYATFMALGVEFKVLCECKQYSSPISREKVVILHSKLKSVGAQQGILLSTSAFQSGAIQYAKSHGIALIRVYDKSCKVLSHSSGKNESDENDPFLYIEKIWPKYEAIDVTAEEALWKVFPPKSIVSELYMHYYQHLRETMGIDI